MIYGKWPYANCRRDPQVIHSIMQKTWPYSRSDINALYSQWCWRLLRIGEICETCWNFSPDVRPEVSDVFRRISSSLTEIPEYAIRLDNPSGLWAPGCELRGTIEVNSLNVIDPDFVRINVEYYVVIGTYVTGFPCHSELTHRQYQYLEGWARRSFN